MTVSVQKENLIRIKLWLDTQCGKMLTVDFPVRDVGCDGNRLCYPKQQISNELYCTGRHNIIGKKTNFTHKVHADTIRYIEKRKLS